MFNSIKRKPEYYINKYSSRKYKNDELHFSEYIGKDDDLAKYVIYTDVNGDYSYKDWANYQGCYEVMLFLNKDMELIKISTDVVHDIQLFTMGGNIILSKPIKLEIKLKEEK